MDVGSVAVPVADAFIQVTVLVAVMVGFFAYLQHRLGARVTRFLLRHWRAGPLLGGLAGVIPGCGGAILVVPLFVRSRVSFGTLVAALVATMGDASFVIIAANPQLALKLHLTLFVAGVGTGYLVDAIGYSPRPKPVEVNSCPCAGLVPAPGQPVHACAGGLAIGTATSPRATSMATVAPATAAERGPVATATLAPPPLGSTLVTVAPRPLQRWVRLAVGLGPAVLAFWAFVIVGVSVTGAVTLQLWDPLQLPRLIAGVDPFLSVGVGGTLAAAFVAHRARLERRGTEQAPQLVGLAAVLREAAQESARIAVWIAVAFLAIEAATELGFAVAAAISVAGIVGVLVGAGLGLIPGCAPQIVLTGLYASGAVPFATLLANALSQDGDALLPLIMLDRRSAVIASVITTIPGLVLGTAVLVLGVSPA